MPNSHFKPPTKALGSFFQANLTQKVTHRTQASLNQITIPRFAKFS